MWPSLVDMSKDDCRKALRTLELETYGGMVDVLRAQGHFSSEKKKLLADVAVALSIPLERHKAEIRRAVNDERLNAIAEVLVGPNTATDWAIEGRRMIPLLPRPKESTVYSVIADECADYVSTERENYLSDDAYKAAECPFSMEPASPEPSKTQTRSVSPSGVLVFPSGTAVQMKRESSEDEGERKKRKATTGSDGIQFNPTGPPSPKVQAGNPQASINSRAVASSLQQSSPLKIALPTTNRPTASNAQNFPSTPKQLIIVSNASSSNTSSILQKTLSFPMKTNSSKSTVIYTQSSSTPNTPEALKPRPKSLQSTPLPKARNTIVVSQKTPVKTVTPGKHVMPMQTKIVVQQKGAQAAQRGTPKPHHVLVQQKPGKQTLVTNLQLKTPQGYTNLPLQLRSAAKPVPIKQDLAGGQVKMVSIASGAKILPKPTQPVYVVPGTTTPLTMVTRTVPAACPSRVMTVTTSGQNVKWNQSPTVAGAVGKSVQVVTQPRRADGVVLVQKGATAKTVASHTIKEGTGNKPASKGLQKPVTTISPSLAQSLQQLSNSQGQPGTNLILVDMNQEKITGNAALADFLQASGIVPETDGKVVPVDVTSGGEETEDSEIKENKDDRTKDDVIPVTTLSIEEAVEMLNRSDTPETRALLSQAGIQISDEIADSEEEEQVVDKSPQPQLPHTAVTVSSAGPREIDLLQDAANLSNQLPTAVTVSVATGGSDAPVTSSAASPSLPAAVQSLASRRTLDIYSTALASANINLDSFMEEEDDPEPETGNIVQEDKEEEATDSAADSSSDPLELQLAELTGEMSQ